VQALVWNLPQYMQTFLKWKTGTIGHPARRTWVATKHPKFGCLLIRQYKYVGQAGPACPGCEKNKASFHRHFAKEVKNYIEEVQQAEPGLAGLLCFAELPVVQYKEHPGDYQFSRVPCADMVFTHAKAVQADQVVIVELDSHLHGDRPFQSNSKTRAEALKAVRQRDQAKDSLYKALGWHCIRLKTADVEHGIVDDRWFHSLHQLLQKHCSV
jgi:hypothetical protein